MSEEPTPAGGPESYTPQPPPYPTQPQQALAPPSQPSGQAPPGQTPGPPAEPPRSSGIGRRAGIVWWGIFLVVIGGLLLLNQFVPRVDLWRYWPLIIVALGIRGMFPSATEGWSLKRAAEGLMGVVIGLILLGQMLGILGWGVWLNIFRLWPLLLIALGLEIIGKGMRSDAVRMLGSLVVIAGLLYGALVMTPTFGWPLVWSVGNESEAAPFASSEAHDPDVRDGTARVAGGVGDFTLTDGKELATAEGSAPSAPEFTATTSGHSADVRIESGSEQWWPSTAARVLNVTLDREVVWDLDVKAGVSTFKVDLRDLPVLDLSLDAGVSDGTLTLGPSEAAGTGDGVEARVNSGVSALEIQVPKGDDVRVSVKSGLSAVSFDGAWDRSDGGDDRVWTSEGFSDADAYWDIEVQAGIGSIEVSYY